EVSASTKNCQEPDQAGFRDATGQLASNVAATSTRGLGCCSLGAAPVVASTRRLITARCGARAPRLRRGPGDAVSPLVRRRVAQTVLLICECSPRSPRTEVMRDVEAHELR